MFDTRQVHTIVIKKDLTELKPRNLSTHSNINTIIEISPKNSEQAKNTHTPLHIKYILYKK